MSEVQNRESVQSGGGRGGEKGEKVIVGEEPTEEDMFYVAWGDQLSKDTLSFLNQVLRQMVTLSVALLAGIIALYDKKMMRHGFMNWAMMILFFSLASSLIGVFPYPFRGLVTRRAPYEIKEAVTKGTILKLWLLRCCGVALALALILLFIGILIGVPTS